MNLKVGDRIRITSVPGEGNPDYYIHPDTVRVYKKLIKRNRPVRIYELQDGVPWYECRFRRKNGQLEYHFLAVYEDDNNWVKVNERNKVL